MLLFLVHDNPFCIMIIAVNIPKPVVKNEENTSMMFNGLQNCGIIDFVIICYTILPFFLLVGVE